MHGIFSESQTSGNDWPQLQRPMAYQSLQESPSDSEPRFQIDMFKGLEKQMADFDTEHDELIAQIRKYYVCPPDKNITAFFKSYRFIPHILIMAVSQLRAAFGADTVFTLRLPADELGCQTIFAVALWPGAATASRAALRHFDEMWWLANAYQASGYLNFTDELV